MTPHPIHRIVQAFATVAPSPPAARSVDRESSALEDLRAFAATHDEDLFAQLVTRALAGESWAIQRVNATRETITRGRNKIQRPPGRSPRRGVGPLDAVQFARLVSVALDGEEWALQIVNGTREAASRVLDKIQLDAIRATSTTPPVT